MLKYKIQPEVIINLRDRQKTFVHHLRQPTVDDIFIVELKCQPTISMKGDELLPSDKKFDPDIELWKSIVLKTEGYTKDDDKNWKSKVPDIHKEKIGAFMAACEILDEEDVLDDFGSDCLCTEPNLLYLKTSMPEGPTLTTHLFNQPEDRHIAQFKRIRSNVSTTVKKSRITVRSKPTCKEYCKLYDELIVEVKGYDPELDLRKDEDIAKIPAVHKIRTVISFFNKLQEEIKIVAGK